MALTRQRHLRADLLRRLLPYIAALLVVSCASYQETEYPGQPLASISRPDSAELRQRARQRLIALSDSFLGLRNEQHFWPGPQETDATIELPLLILNRVLEINDPELEAEGINRILSTQDTNTGLWTHSPGSPPNVSNTGTLLLTLEFLDPGLVETPLMRKAEKWFLEKGGVEKISLFHKLLLTVGGILPSHHLMDFSPLVLAVPEGMLISVFNLGLAREFVIPLSAWSYYLNVNRSGAKASPLTENDIQAGFGQNFGKPFKAGILPEGRVKKNNSRTNRKPFYFLGEFTRKMTPGDEEYWAKQALAWITQGQAFNGIWAGTSLTSYVALMALHQAQNASVYDFTPWLKKGFRGLSRWKAKLNDGQVVSQPFPGPVMDTARALDSYYCAKHIVPESYEEAQSSIAWLIAQQTSGTGDGQFLHHQDPSIGGWAFQIGNPYYPDHDDTAMVLLSLLQSAGQLEAGDPGYPALTRSIDKGLIWLLHRQNRDGGFAAWAQNSSSLFSYITKKGIGGAPEVHDQSQADVTSRVLHTLGFLQQSASDIHISKRGNKLREVIGKSCRFLKRKRKSVEGIPVKVWRGDWVVNYIYASSEAVAALLSSECWQAEDAKEVVDWITQSQNPDGGWGEKNESMGLGRFIPGRSTITQTLFALNGLIHYELERREHAAHLHSIRPSIDKAVRYLLDSTRGELFPQEKQFSAVFIKGVWYGRYMHGPHYEFIKVLGQYLKL